MTRRAWLRGAGSAVAQPVVALPVVALPVVATASVGTAAAQTGAPRVLAVRGLAPPSGLATSSGAQTTPNVWAATLAGSAIAESVADVAPRVYVPHEIGGDVAVIDPASRQVIQRFVAGRVPHHVTPSYDLSRLYVSVMSANRLVEVDARTGQPLRYLPVVAPYNLYFSLDGGLAIVAAELFNRLDFYDPATWQPVARLPIRASGIDHLDLSADGSYLLVSAEFDGQVVKVDLERLVVASAMRVGGLPIDIKLAPTGDVFYVANQGRHGVSIVDPEAMQEVGFLPTGRGAHGMAISRDTQYLYVSNRLAGTLSVVEFATQSIVATWFTGASPDMLQVSPDGSELWVSNRWHGLVDVVDTTSGAVQARIRTGSGPHGLTYFPQPGRFSLGHNGVYR